MKSDDDNDNELLNNLWNKNKNVENFLNTVFEFLRKKTNVFQRNSFSSEPTKLIDLTTNIIRRWHYTRVALQRPEESAADTYNGGSFNGYSWSQTIQDLDIQVPVPSFIKKSKDVKINLSRDNILNIEIRNQENNWTQILNDHLKYSVQLEAMVWSLEPGKVIQLHLEKSKEMWWDGLTMSESPIDLQSIDASRPMEDLGQEEQMKIAELFWKNRNKSLINQSN